VREWKLSQVKWGHSGGIVKVIDRMGVKLS
jgi:hypothetical protein